MPVRSSVCTYSPSSVSSTNKYSTLSSLSVGQYKPLSSATGVSPTSSSSSFRSSTGHYRNGSSTTTSPSSSRYSLSSTTSTSSSASSASSAYSPLNRSSYSPSTLGNSNNKTSLHSTYGVNNYQPSSSSPITTPYKPLSSSLTTSNHGRYSRTGSNFDHHLSSPSSSSSRYSSAGSSASLSSTTSDYLSHRDNHHLTSAGSTSSAYSTASSNSSYNAYSSLSSPRRSSYTSQHTPVSPAETLPPGVPRGLINLGNTCYMNAVLQSLYSIESLRSLMLRTSSSDKVLTAELSDLFRTIKDSASPISPANFKYAFSRYQSKFSGLGQQDAQEFLRYLINGVHEESNLAAKRPRRKVLPQPPKSSQEAWSQYRDIVDDSPLVDLVVGQLCSTIICGQCQNKSYCWDPFWDLSLPLARGRYSLKLSDVVDEFTAKETLDSDERPICSQCKKATKSTKQISLSRLPQVLILHLKKFTNDGYKLTSPDIKIDKQLTFNSNTTYNLKACISHHGHSSSSGHYTCHCEYATKWYHFNDDRVKDVTSSFDSSRLDDAYVLFYTQASASCANNIKSAYHHQSKL